MFFAIYNSFSRGQAIGKGGTKDLTKEELIRFQQVEIKNSRFVEMGFRQKGGFVGEHDRVTGEPLSEHTSAKWENLQVLTNGLIVALNQTIDYYRYFDATLQAEFLYDCVHDTIEHIIPAEVSSITRYDAFKSYIEEEFEMPDNMVALLVRFLEQNEGKISKRARENEFAALHNYEISDIEKKYKIIMLDS